MNTIDGHVRYDIREELTIQFSEVNASSVHESAQIATVQSGKSKLTEMI